MLADFYNHSESPDQVVANDRWGVDEHGCYHGDYYTPERKVVETRYRKKWETCDSLDPYSWGYRARTKEKEYMTVSKIIAYLADIVSKNGNFLLNIGPMADGTIPDVQRERLLGVGQWLKVNSEAIFNTRPWDIAEGFTSEGISVRFTQNRDNLYALLLGTPHSHQVTIKGIRLNNNDTVIHLLGHKGALKWKQEGYKCIDLTIFLPGNLPESPAHAFKITPQPHEV